MRSLPWLYLPGTPHGSSAPQKWPNYSSPGSPGPGISAPAFPDQFCSRGLWPLSVVLQRQRPPRPVLSEGSKTPRDTRAAVPTVGWPLPLSPRTASCTVTQHLLCPWRSVSGDQGLTLTLDHPTPPGVGSQAPWALVRVYRGCR